MPIVDDVQLPGLAHEQEHRQFDAHAGGVTLDVADVGDLHVALLMMVGSVVVLGEVLLGVRGGGDEQSPGAPGVPRVQMRRGGRQRVAQILLRDHVFQSVVCDHGVEGAIEANAADIADVMGHMKVLRGGKVDHRPGLIDAGQVEAVGVEMTN